MLRCIIAQNRRKIEPKTLKPFKHYSSPKNIKNMHLDSKFFDKTQMPLISSSTLSHGGEKKTIASPLP